MHFIYYMYSIHLIYMFNVLFIHITVSHFTHIGYTWYIQVHACYMYMYIQYLIYMPGGQFIYMDNIRVLVWYVHCTIYVTYVHYILYIDVLCTRVRKQYSIRIRVRNTYFIDMQHIFILHIAILQGMTKYTACTVS